MSSADSPTAIPGKWVIGNWKMNGLSGNLAAITSLRAMLEDYSFSCRVMICPPATLLHQAAQIMAGSRLRLGGQDCHQAASGAHTGDLSAPMLKDAGACAVILGHSERRHHHDETSAIVRAKAEAAHSAGLTAIICIGETADERDTGQTLTVLTDQLRESLPDGTAADNTVIAYEPVWAIGAGVTPSPRQVEDLHGGIRAWLTERLGPGGAAISVLYGGSVNPANAGSLLTRNHVDGALVGGASLDAQDFFDITKSYIDR